MPGPMPGPRARRANQPDPVRTFMELTLKTAELTWQCVRERVCVCVCVIRLILLAHSIPFPVTYLFPYVPERTQQVQELW